MSLSPRIAPLEAPFSESVTAMLAKWMGPGLSRPPLALFRTLARNLELAGRMHPLGSGLLGRGSALRPEEREIVIDRVCARCGCVYEWGVHAAVFGPALKLPESLLRATVLAPATDAVWTERQAALVQLVDELHDTGQVSDALWRRLEAGWSPEQCLELLVLSGWYHAIAYVANAVAVPLEPWAAPWPR